MSPFRRFDLNLRTQALSNQKYREMLAEFGDVGLMTGDVTINPSATCLVMTTEVYPSLAQIQTNTF